MGKSIVVQKPKQPSCELYSPQYYALSAAGGAATCGLTHTLLAPLDVVKVRLQVSRHRYTHFFRTLKESVRQSGFATLTRGWAPTLAGYSLQGAAKFSSFEYFKHALVSGVSPHTAHAHYTALYLAAAAGAELVADCFLAPFEATKVRMQTAVGEPGRMSAVMCSMYRREGLGAFYRGLPLLWARQVPYTMTKYVAFWRAEEYLFEHAVMSPRSRCTPAERLGVAVAASYVTGALCALVSHPPDTIVSRLNADPSATVRGAVRAAGPLGVWRGLLPRALTLGSLVAMQALVYGTFHKYANMPLSKAPPASPTPTPSASDHEQTD